MDTTSHDLEFSAVPHPDPRVRYAGFDLGHRYVEQCWGPVLGPSGVAILRRLPVLWATQEPARISSHDFARSLGLGGGSGSASRLQRSLDRTVRFGLAHWVEPGRALRVYTEVPPLGRYRLAKLPDWTRQAHDRLLGDHVDHLIATTGGHQQHQQHTPTITERLDRLQQPRTPPPSRISPVPGIGR